MSGKKMYSDKGLTPQLPERRNQMPNHLSASNKEDIASLFLTCRSIKAVTRKLGFSRNTVRSVVRSLSSALTTTPIPPSELAKEPEEGISLDALDFSLLERMFEAGRGSGSEPLEFEKHIKKIAVSIAKEMGIRGTLDQVRLETALAQYIVYRRFYFRSLEALDACRGAIGLVKLWQLVIDNNYAMAA
jgi:hypothetical protein